MDSKTHHNRIGWQCAFCRTRAYSGSLGTDRVLQEKVAKSGDTCIDFRLQIPPSADKCRDKYGDPEAGFGANQT